MSKRHFLVLLIVLPFVLVGCKIETINSFPVKNAHVRVINTVPNASALNISVDGNVKWPSLPFEGMTDYEDFSNETHTFSATVEGATTTLVEGNFNLAGEAQYTLVTFGPIATPGLVLLSDETVTPTSGRFLVRIANLATGASPFDVYLTAPGVDITTVSPTISAVVYGGSTGFLQLSSGTLQVRLAISGTQTVIYDSGAHVFPDNTATDAIAYTRNGGQLVNMALADINGANQRVIANSTIAQIKIVNAAFDAGAINAYLDNAGLAADLAYPAGSAYTIVGQGSHTVTFEAASTPGAAIATLMTSLDAATDTSVFVTGFAGSNTAVPIHDFNYPPADANNSRLRIVNASPDSPPLDILVNNTRQVAALASLADSPYVEFANGTYTITVNNAATGATVYTLSGLGLLASQTSTLYLIGPAAQLTSLFTRDN